MEIICRAGKMSPRERKNIRLLFPELLHKHVPLVTRVRAAHTPCPPSLPDDDGNLSYYYYKTPDRCAIPIRLRRVTAAPWRKRRRRFASK